MFTNPDDEQILALLKRIERIAVLGLSPRADRPSHGVAKSMLGFGYKVVPVNPGHDEILGQTSYPSLADVPHEISLVDVFRASEYVPEIIDQCVDLKLPAVWLQEGVVHAAAAERARDAGLFVVMDRCIYKEYKRLV